MCTSLRSCNLLPDCASFVKDHMSNRSFMVDTDFSCSIWFYPLDLDKPSHSSVPLHVVNLSFIKNYEQIVLNIGLNLWRHFKSIFEVADLLYPILSADFLNHFNQLVDVRKLALVDGSTTLSSLLHVSTNISFNSPSFTIATGNLFHTQLASFPGLVDPTSKPVKVVHTTHNHITMSRPVISFLECLIPDRLKIDKAKSQRTL